MSSNFLHLSIPIFTLQQVIFLANNCNKMYHFAPNNYQKFPPFHVTFNVCFYLFILGFNVTFNTVQVI